MADWLERNATPLFWGFLLLHVTAWTLVPSLLNANLPLDVIEGWAWGRVWDWGYPKHPPLTRWLGDLAALASARGDWAQYLLSQVFVALSFFAIWHLAQDSLAPRHALLAVLLMEGIYFHNFTTPEFNPNVVLLAFWSIAILCFRRATARASHGGGSLGWWALFGLTACLGLWTKYFMALLLLPMVLLVLFDPGYRRSLRTAGPYLAVAIAVVGLAPHLYWIVESDFRTLFYAVGRAAHGSSDWSDHLLHPLRFLLELVPVLLPVALLIFALGRPRLTLGPQHAELRRSLLVLGLGPIALLFLLSLATGWRIKTMWSAPLFVLTGLLLVTWLQPQLSNRALRRFVVAFAFIFLLAPLAYLGTYAFGPALSDTAKRTQFPGRDLSLRIGQEWQSRFGDRRPVIIADHWYGGNAIYYSDPSSPLYHARHYINSDSRATPWVGDPDVREHGGIAIWRYGFEGVEGIDRLPAILADCRERFGTCDYQEPFALEWHSWLEVPRILIGWATIPPPPE